MVTKTFLGFYKIAQQQQQQLSTVTINFQLKMLNEKFCMVMSEFVNLIGKE